MVIDITTEDTIAAISTPWGEGGIGIVRLSGKNAMKIADRVFVGKNGAKPSQFPSFTVHYGFIVAGRQDRQGRVSRRKQKVIDEVILTVMHSPYTYTKEDVVEINCHGGIVCFKKILQLVIDYGARLAYPGEFTQRAFLNGRIDLAQAEAVLNVVKSKTDLALSSAMNQLQGALSGRIDRLKNILIEIVAPLEAAIDFPDEEIDERPKKALSRALKTLSNDIKSLIDSADNGIMLQNGISVAFAGSPNVGKSSLMNRFVDYERVIVTHISGTTRDVVEEVVNIDGLPIRIADTAGIIDSKCLIAKKSVDKSLAFLNKADLVLFVLDASQKISKADSGVARQLKNKKVLIVINKIDLARKITLASIKKIMPKIPIVEISALKGFGIEKLKKEIVRLFFHGEIPKNDEFLVINIRHKQILENCRQNILKAIEIASTNGYDECLVFEIRQALYGLGEIVGENLDEHILNNIFSRFCIGK